MKDKTMSWSEFIETDEVTKLIEDYIQDAYWRRDFNPAVLLDFIVKHAEKNNVKMINLEEIDFESELHAIWECTEKGLS